MSNQRYMQRGVSASKEDVHNAIKNIDKGIFPQAFCKIIPDILARPTLSLAKYLQQVGRGLRRSEGKEACMLIDNVGLYRIFGLPTQRWNWVQ